MITASGISASQHVSDGAVIHHTLKHISTTFYTPRVKFYIQWVAF